MTTKAKDAKEFGEKLKALRLRLLEERPGAAPVIKAKGGKPKAKPKAAPKIKVPAGAITQPEAKHMAPRGAFIWRNTSSQAWCGKMPPLGELSRSWNAHGHRASCILVLRELWLRAIRLGLATECAVADLYSEAIVQEPARP